MRTFHRSSLMNLMDVVTMRCLASVMVHQRGAATNRCFSLRSSRRVLL